MEFKIFKFNISSVFKEDSLVFETGVYEILDSTNTVGGEIEKAIQDTDKELKLLVAVN